MSAEHNAQVDAVVIDLLTDAKTLLDPRNPMASARVLVRECFTDNEGRRTLHRHRGCFWKYHRGCYRLTEDENIRADVWTFLERASRLDDKDRPTSFKPSKARVADVIDALAAVCSLGDHISPPAWLGALAESPAAEEFIAVSNGLLHMPSGDLYPPSPEFFNLSASGVIFDPDAPSPRHWLKFLADLFGDDSEAVEALQDWFGYTLTPDTSQHKICLIVGPTRSGKGTIARVLTQLIGKDCIAAPTLAGLSSNFGQEPLIGKPLAIISDARLSGRADQAAIAERLLSISGEDSLTIDRKFRPSWTGRLSTRFMLLTNELPRLADSSGALAKRFVVLVLERSFYGREDHGLTDRLLTELSGILNWARVGYERLRNRGHFQQPESARDAIGEMEALSSPVTAFIRESCHLAPGLTTPTKTLFNAWRDWCSENGRTNPGTAQSFGRDLRAAYPAIKTKQHRDDGERVRSHEGIGVI